LENLHGKEDKEEENENEPQNDSTEGKRQKPSSTEKNDADAKTRKQRKNIRSRERRKSNAKAETEAQNTTEIPEQTENQINAKERRKLKRKEHKKELQQAKKLELEAKIKEQGNEGKGNKVKKGKMAKTAKKEDAKSDTKSEENPAPKPEPKKPNSTKLDGARFRILNQKLYTISSQDAKSMFQQDKNMAEIYHKGYTEQVKKWPVNPVFIMLDFVLLKSKKCSPNNKLVVADLGCGDAKLARGVYENGDENLAKVIKIHSFDLYKTPTNEKYVTIADIKTTPLNDNSVDIAIFCLSLMGTNLHEFLIEANRILKTDSGILKIAEVRSRFGEKERLGLNKFIKGLQNLGFYFNKKNEGNKVALDYKNNPNSHFLVLELKKVRDVNRKVVNESLVNSLKLEPCIYKRR